MITNDDNINLSEMSKILPWAQIVMQIKNAVEESGERTFEGFQILDTTDYRVTYTSNKTVYALVVQQHGMSIYGTNQCFASTTYRGAYSPQIATLTDVTLTSRLIHIMEMALFRAIAMEAEKDEELSTDVDKV